MRDIEDSLHPGGSRITGILRIGTRGSALALTQTRWVADKLKQQLPDAIIEVKIIKTKGDILQDISLSEVGGKGLFVKEIEEALLRGDIDLAVHSMKDVPVEIPDALEIGIMTEREDPRDVLISKSNRALEEMPRSARIGTGSLRRGFQLKSLYPAMEVVPLRGNLDTRINKITTMNLDGIIVAAAGMKRMGWTHRISQYIALEAMLPSVGQGVLGIEIRKEDQAIKDTVAFINHPETWLEVTAERAFLKRLEGGCQLPVAGYAEKKGSKLILKGLLGSPDGHMMIRDEIEGSCEGAEMIGVSLAERILSCGGKAILESVCRNDSGTHSLGG